MKKKQTKSRDLPLSHSGNPEPLKVDVERTDNGKFLPDNQEGRENRGRCVVQREAYKKAIHGNLDLGKLAQAFVKLQDMAVAGDVNAIKELLNRTEGKVAKGIEVSEPEKPAYSEARAVAFLLKMGSPIQMWPPGTRRRYEQGLIEGYPKKEQV